ncbi:uroporphyrinogen-III C-methyltransferase [Enterococcus haemoperoxidus ATCC BAA-382]|uniref:Uroporphyrinogen-III C-methyltransferase n=1 Tax=Enterococcus haemoperoxidus ATCC BAA-382 TaxID=1158608 RepID=R2SKK4_9ENTE|nr:uroporphyrinogen-III C-methyltransferase [Enterococcus haemoperoxidus]EOH93366.1 uroporphyrinogen-III C-methyltransferase [Enterococcus haemoperoxidus ATCC BAA-382]EOT61320.1 uroporphyrinogen-III C-methyltransferase [Enterococcus haemoperoxidus ATCC BAA-382]OJG54502.1 uroporphyrinogen-III C-methyltransferase [Enterococcus haemoperoxidus]
MGNVYFVGAGSGDPELLTLKGKRVLESADVIIYDRLVHPVLLYLAKDSARFIYSGKYPKNHVLKQKNINQLLLEEGRKNQIVVRLKGGDPGIFGRVGEEISILQSEGIGYEIIPGVTAASVASSYSGIPLTHRAYSSKVTLATAHRQAGEIIDFKDLTDNGTMCLYMGVEKVQSTQKKLLEQDVSPQLPVAIVEWGSLGRQRTVAATVQTLVKAIEEHQIQNPSLIILGDVVSCRNGADWFEQLPLFGHKILLIDTEKIDFEIIISYTQKGADVYAIQVGKNRDQRFDEVHQQYLRDHYFDEIIYLNEELTTMYKKQWDILNKKFV